MITRLVRDDRLFDLTPLLLIGFLSAGQESPGDALRRFLLERTSFRAADLAAVDSGRIVTRILHSDDKREIAVLGIARLDVAGEFSVAQLRGLRAFNALSGPPDFGLFSNPPSLADVEDLELPREDLEGLRTCRVGACEVKLPAPVIERFQREIDWDSPDFREAAAALLRRIIVDYVASYLKEGNAALATYADKEEPLSVAEGLEIVRQDAVQLAEFLPELHAYLAEFPDGKPAGAEDYIYWVKEEFGLKPVISIYHSTVYRPDGRPNAPAFITAKQLYASHYFHATLNIFGVVDDSAGAEPAAYILYARRVRLDGELTGFKRLLVRSRTSHGIRSDLERIRARLEAAYAAGLSAEGGN